MLISTCIYKLYRKSNSCHLFAEIFQARFCITLFCHNSQDESKHETTYNKKSWTVTKMNKNYLIMSVWKLKIFNVVSWICMIFRAEFDVFRCRMNRCAPPRPQIVVMCNFCAKSIGFDGISNLTMNRFMGGTMETAATPSPAPLSTKPRVCSTVF